MTEERIWELVERLGTLVRAERRRAAGALGLQPVHLQVLEYLSRCNRYSNTPQAVAAYLGTTKGTISQSLAVLERGGWIRKRSDPADGRVVRLEMEGTGEVGCAGAPARCGHARGAAPKLAGGQPVSDLRGLPDLPALATGGTRAVPLRAHPGGPGS